ncbi:MAG: hypothetical protein GC155_14465 [Alphaproteobacteria bacterium]|nr:hypothetical protein [Alphaproteobacteria bacterium]
MNILLIVCVLYLVVLAVLGFGNLRRSPRGDTGVWLSLASLALSGLGVIYVLATQLLHWPLSLWTVAPLIVIACGYIALAVLRVRHYRRRQGP